MQNAGCLENNNKENEKKDMIDFNDLYTPPILVKQMEVHNVILNEETYSENEKIIERMIRANSVTKTAITNIKIKY